MHAHQFLTSVVHDGMFKCSTNWHLNRHLTAVKCLSAIQDLQLWHHLPAPSSQTRLYGITKRDANRTKMLGLIGFVSWCCVSPLFCENSASDFCVYFPFDGIELQVYLPAYVFICLPGSTIPLLLCVMLHLKRHIVVFFGGMITSATQN